MIFIAIHIILVVALVILILLQPPASDGLGSFGVSGGGLGSVFSVRSYSGAMSKLTAWVAFAFILSNLLLVVFFVRSARKDSIADRISTSKQELSDSIPFEHYDHE